MNDETGFMNAIIQAPGDDLPRLVFADWLEERDDDRAHFIRVRRKPSPLSRLP